MPTENAKLLIVDDTALVRALLSAILARSGYTVLSAEDGFSALAAIRREVPDLILSDLYMPGMSGFELLSVVRRRFPAIPLIAMSSAFSGASVPPGVAADAFYEKGTAVSYLLDMLEALIHSERMPAIEHSSAPAPIWIAKDRHGPAGEPYVTIACPECLRTFPQSLKEDAHVIHETDCVFCRALIHFAIVESADLGPPPERKHPIVGWSSPPRGLEVSRSPRAL
ncbi:MAG: response regulator [Acidobacteriaceae bacterium]